MTQGIFKCQEFQEFKDASRLADLDFLRETLLGCTKEDFVAFSRAEIKDFEAKVEDSKSLVSSAE